MKSIYIHIPFCAQKCFYCAFSSYPDKLSLSGEYINALIKEMSGHKNFNAQTLYIGGGTPSVLSEENLEKLFKAVEENFGPVKNFLESTFEANPESLTEEKIILLKKYGFNRLSMGLQSSNDDILKNLGRIHDRRMFIKSYSDARSMGFDNINIDLIAGCPSQNLENFKEDISFVLTLNPEHFSVYGMEISEGTKFFKEGYAPDDALVKEMLLYAHNFLPKRAYSHYEISNFSKHGFESVHNNNYWLGGDYLGLGCAAAGYLNGTRSSNTDDLNKYINNMEKGLGVKDFEEKLEGKKKTGESAMIALRRLEGVKLTSEISGYFGQEIDALVSRRLLTKENGCIKLSEQGLFFANKVFSCFVEPFGV
ncbi:Putative oxygen-independent coproporphyrinogen III oxidase [Elusimicrobium minutum Pei191]|uniref:Heme chaperone HemW n=1 Tax=Elusimicrobium minutum (strain Pei191) TaxID=445932 RepID=B2KAS6_ELUMP|nr:radical SAM family heme chaperone HemW [Elusimicrobium minutum]ACC97622.1 Putative oxygen-independent coproporphyrinogen III oxidase [Elusimicrobium minutum Pei191]